MNNKNIENLFLGLFLFVGGKSNLNKMAENHEFYDAEIYAKIDIVGELVLKGANTKIRNDDRKYQMDIARANNSAAIFEILREAKNRNQ